MWIFGEGEGGGGGWLVGGNKKKLLSNCNASWSLVFVLFFCVHGGRIFQRAETEDRTKVCFCQGKTCTCKATIEVK